MSKIQRIRDPIHGLITFNLGEPIDSLAWKIIETEDFQRLRRIKQLGLADTVFPGATHTRFAHSIGVYHNARKLIDALHRDILEEDQKKDRQDVILIASLLHDIGHGPFSHAFENARKTLAIEFGWPRPNDHEHYTAEIIADEQGDIYKLLENYQPGFSNQVYKVFKLEEPSDVYHAVLSSSFDADRLDYLVRDRYMSGTGTGAIDVDWLIDNLVSGNIIMPQDDDEIPNSIPTLAFKNKGRQAAEDFLLARYRLYTQVYYHKTVRGFEKILTALIVEIGKAIANNEEFPLPQAHPLRTFLMQKDPDINAYKRLDDLVMWGAIEMLQAEGVKGTLLQKISSMLWLRKRPHALDITRYASQDIQQTIDMVKRVYKNLEGSSKMNNIVFEDNIDISMYASVQGEPEKVHKMVRICEANGELKDILSYQDTVISDALRKKRRITRFYFLEREDYEDAKKTIGGY